jgi:hypothetical protein
MEAQHTDGSHEHQQRGPSPTSTGQVCAADLSGLARALVAAALAVHPRPAGNQMVAGRPRVAGSARWRFHPPGQHDRNTEGGCD